MKFNLDKKTKKKNSKFIVFGIFFLVFGIYLGNNNVVKFFESHYYLLRSSQIVNSIFTNNDLEKVYLNISFKNLSELNKKRKSAIQDGYLKRNNDDFVKAGITHNGVNIFCKVRIKGDFDDHWKSDKFSLRVKISNDKTLLGMSEFSLQNPVVRGNTSEWVFLKTIKSQNLISVGYKFVNLFINGEKKGIFAMEEHFTKELIERHKRREGVIVGFEDQKIVVSHTKGLRNINYEPSYRKLSVKHYNFNSGKKKNLISQFTAASKLISEFQNENLSGETIFMPSKMGQFLAICHILGAEHNFQVNNIKFYFNPMLGQLEPIAFDGCPHNSIKSPYQYFSDDVPEHSFWVKIALNSPVISYHYIKFLELYSSKSFIDSLKQKFYSNEMKYRRLLLRELILKSPTEIFNNFSTLLFRDPWEIIEARCARIRKELSLDNPIIVKSETIKNKLLVTVYNSTMQPVEIIGFKINGNFIRADKNLISLNHLNPTDNDNLNAVVLNKGIRGADIHQWRFETPSPTEPNHEVIFRLWGLSNEAKIIEFSPMTFSNKALLPNYLKNKKPLIEFSFINRKSNNQYVVKTGYHKVNTDFVVPREVCLIINPKTTFEFENNTTLICLGQINATGGPTNPITFTSQDSYWGGLFLYNPSKTSEFRNCHFKNIIGVGNASNPMGIDRSGWNTTGAVTVYKTEANFLNCVFKNVETEDALNIYDCKLNLIDCNFTNTYSDAFDGDFVSGSVLRCNFDNVGGDGVDFSGSDVNVTGCSFYNISDKAISVGENSYLYASDIYVEKVSFGVVSKDFSSVKLENSIIRRASVSGVSAYQKKPEFGSADISYVNVNFEDCLQDHMIQIGSTGKHDKKILKTKIFSADSLYQK